MRNVATAGERRKAQLEAQREWRREQEKVALQIRADFAEINAVRGTKGGRLLIHLWEYELQNLRDRLEDAKVTDPRDAVLVGRMQSKIETYNYWLSLLAEPELEDEPDA